VVLLQLAGQMPRLPSQNSGLRAKLIDNRDYMDGLMDVSERLGVWIELAQQQGQLNPGVPAMAVLYTLYARACDPVLEFLKASTLYTDGHIVDMVITSCFDGLASR
jgi:TetR/AcrR family transcriptional regulator, regulator of autoinduction and epiphytic fitness